MIQNFNDYNNINKITFKQVFDIIEKESIDWTIKVFYKNNSVSLVYDLNDYLYIKDLNGITNLHDIDYIFNIDITNNIPVEFNTKNNFFYIKINDLEIIFRFTPNDFESLMNILNEK